MKKMSMSFRMGQGWLAHNLRITTENRPRQNGVMERRQFNEYIVDNPTDKPDELIRRAVERKIGGRLKEINEKHIQQGNAYRVRTIDQWIQSKSYTRGVKQKKILCEYIVQVGNKYTGCPYEIQLDADGNMIDVAGNKIKPKDTRRTPAYRDGIVTESEICRELKQVYKEYVTEFKKRNPQAEVVCASIHGDEKGGVHMHINVIWFSKTKNDVGYGIAETMAIRQQYDEMHVKYGNSRFDNAQNKWRVDMRVLLKQVAMRHGIEYMKMNNKEPHREHDEFCEYKDDLCAREAALDERQSYLNDRQAELDERQAELDERQADLDERDRKYSSAEWWYIYKHYPEVYKEAHSKCWLKGKIKSVDNSK